MIQESYNKSILMDSSTTIKTSICEDRRETFDEKKHWKVTDKITFPDGKVEVREYYNTVVDDCSRLIACLLKSQAGYTGITYWAVGSGSTSWDNNNPPAPVVSDNKLLNETFRKAIPAGNIKFLDVNDAYTETVTNKIEVKLSFLENEANGDLREFALYGGNATATKGSGIMINRKTHGLIYKTSGMQLERTIRLVF